MNADLATASRRQPPPLVSGVTHVVALAGIVMVLAGVCVTAGQASREAVQTVSASLARDVAPGTAAASDVACRRDPAAGGKRA